MNIAENIYKRCVCIWSPTYFKLLCFNDVEERHLMDRVFFEEKYKYLF